MKAADTMAHQRTGSTIDAGKEPHSVSLKVLRLSKPSLATQHALAAGTPGAFGSTSGIAPSASLAYPSANNDQSDAFILSPLLALPPAFGSAYVGETFSCTLCANNELLEDAAEGKKITGVKIEAEMKTPSASIALELGPSNEARDHEEVEERDPLSERDFSVGRDPTDLAPEQSLQNIVSYHLMQEGTHVLAVTVKYTESTAQSGRIRTFRKLYQFVAKACMVVRTKTGSLPDGFIGEGEKRRRLKRWALEAQLENCGEESICLENVALESTEGLRSMGLNWQIEDRGREKEKPVLNPKDVQQVCFLIMQADGMVKGAENGRLTIGQLSIGWRSAQGNQGTLSTGWLATKLT